MRITLHFAERSRLGGDARPTMRPAGSLAFFGFEPLEDLQIGGFRGIGVVIHLRGRDFSQGAVPI